MTVTSNLVGEAWNELDKDEQVALGKEVQKKWKSIKDCYYKNIKGQESKGGDAVKPKKNYIYHKQLSFLQSAFAERWTSGNMDNDSVGNTTDNDSQHEEEDINYTTQIENMPNTSTSSSLTHPHRRRVPQKENQSPFPKKRRVDDFEHQYLDVLQVDLQNSTTKESTMGVKDPDEMLLLSQMPLIKNMSSADKMDFQVKYLQLVQSYSYPRSPYNSPSTSDHGLS